MFRQSDFILVFLWNELEFEQISFKLWLKASKKFQTDLMDSASSCGPSSFRLVFQL